MSTLSERTSRTITLGTQPVHIVANPALAGPVVLATDGASESGSSVLTAIQLAARIGRRLEIISVLESLPTFSAGPDVVVALDQAIDARRRTEREAAVRAYVKRFAPDTAAWTIHVRFGNVATEIARFARESDATLVVMGSAPHRRFQHTVSGERAAQVVHATACPVLSVPPTDGTPPHTMIVAVDFGASSTRAVLTALLLVRPGGRAILTHVLPPPVRVSWLKMVSDEELALNINALFAQLRDDIGPAIPDGVTVETRIITGDAVDAMLSLASEESADLIAVGTHGPARFARLFLGGVATSLLHAAQRSVLVAPPPRAANAPDRAHVQEAERAAREQTWAAALDAFSDRNVHRAATLETEDVATGTQITGRGYAFLGVTYETATDSVEIMVGDPADPVRHLTRSILHPDAITITPTVTGDGEVLDIRHGYGHTIAVVTGETLT